MIILDMIIKIVPNLFQFKIVSDIDKKLKFVAEKGPEREYFQLANEQASRMPHPTVGFLCVFVIN